MNLSLDDLDDLERFLCQRFRCYVREKGDSDLIRAIAAGFDVADLLGANVPTGLEFQTRFATTLGPVVFLPSGLPRGERRTKLLLHELGHGNAFWEAPLYYPRAYLQSGEARARFEAEAERGRIEGAWLLWGELPTAEFVGDFIAHGYACDAPDVALAQQLVDIGATSADSGVVQSPVGRAVRDWRLAREQRA